MQSYICAIYAILYEQDMQSYMRRYAIRRVNSNFYRNDLKVVYFSFIHSSFIFNEGLVWYVALVLPETFPL